MNPYSSMLDKAVEEISQFKRNGLKAKGFNKGWLDNLATCIGIASAVSGKESAEHEIETISRMIVDSGPLTEDFAPSFFDALGAVQRGRKRHRLTS